MASWYDSAVRSGRNIEVTDNEVRDTILLEGVMFRAMDDEGLTFGEAVAILFLTRDQKPTNNNPGIFAGMEPIR